MLHEILYALLGFTGDIIVDKGSTFAVKNGFNLLTQSEHDQINRLVPLGWYYNQLQLLVESNQIQWKLHENPSERDQSYRSAIALGISDLLTEYAEDIAYLEQYILTEGPTPLSYLLQHLQKYLIVMPIVHEMAMEIDSKGIRGCEILDYISTIRSGIPVVNDVIKRFLHYTRTLFVKQSIAWSLFGELDDPGKEFMIHKREAYKHLSSNARKQIKSYQSINEEVSHKLNDLMHIDSESYDIDDTSFDWLSSYYLRLELLPESQITLRLASKILFCGKAVKLLQYATRNNSFKYSAILESSGYKDFYQYFAGDGNITMTKKLIKSDHSNTVKNQPNIGESVLHYNNPSVIQDAATQHLLSNGFDQIELNRFIQRFDTLEKNIDTSFEYFEPLVTDIHDVLSKKLWLWLKDEMKFLSFLKAMRSVYLVGRGEFFQSLLDQVLVASLDDVRYVNGSIIRSEMLSSLSEQVRADMVLDEALQNTVKLLGFDDTVISKIISIRVTVSEFNFPTPLSRGPSLGMSLFGSAKFKLFESKDVGYVSLCSCDEIVRQADDIEDYYRLGLMIEETALYEDEKFEDNDISIQNQASHLPSENYVNGSFALTDQRYIAKGFTTSYTVFFDWNALHSTLTPNHKCFRQPASQRTFSSPLRSRTTPSRRLRSVCLGSVALVLHNDRLGPQTIGTGAFGVDGMAGSVSVGVSIYARLVSLPGSSELFVQYQLRLYVSYMHHSSNSLRDGKIQQADISMGPEQKNRTISAKGYQYEVIEETLIDVTLGSSQSQPTDEYSSLAKRSINGLDAMKVDIEYTRDSQASSQSTRKSGLEFPSMNSLSSPIKSSTADVGSMTYLIRARVSSNKISDTSSYVNDYDLPWDLQVPIDLSKYLRLQGGQSCVSYIGSSLDLTENLSTKEPINESLPPVKPDAKSSCLGIDIMKLSFDSKGALASYPVASPFTSARYPDTVLRLDGQVKKFRLWMNLKLQFQFPDTFRVVMDSDGIACYERVFSMLMKIRLVGNALEKLWLSKFRLSNDRLFCHLRHSMLFFISNLLFYLQVDVIDSEFSSLMNEINHAVDMQVVLKAHRNFLTNLARSSFIDNITVQECFDRILQVCLRFLSICRIVQSESDPLAHLEFGDMNIKVSSSMQQSYKIDSVLQQASQTGSIQIDPALPIVVPPEELDAVRKEFFSQVSYLFSVMSRIDNKGFMFRLDFNNYLSEIVSENLAASKARVEKSMDILDLFNGAGNPGKTSAPTYSAPIELMSRFLVAVTSNQYSEALLISEEILSFEPNNKLIHEYKDSLLKYIENDARYGSESDDEEDSDEEDNNTDDEHNDDEDDDDEDSSEEESDIENSNKQSDASTLISNQIEAEESSRLSRK